jgi:hypothetical protein
MTTQDERHIAESVAYDGDTPYVLCGVEGCPRSTPEGQDQVCGLAHIYGILQSPHTPLCGAVATVDLWIEQGLLDG